MYFSFIQSYKLNPWSYIQLSITITVVMRFLLVCLWVWLIILRLLPNHYNDPSMTTVTGESRETVRFATRLLLDSCGAVVANWNRYNRLRTKRLYRAHRPAVVIVTLLLASGDIESNPGPVYQYPCTVCLKPVKQNQRGIQGTLRGGWAPRA